MFAIRGLRLDAVCVESDMVDEERVGVGGPSSAVHKRRHSSLSTTSTVIYERLRAMSLQLNLSSRDLTQAYEDVVNARGIDWAIFSYDKGTNDLKLQATGDGGLEELQEEFSDGRYSIHPMPLPLPHF